MSRKPVVSSSPVTAFLGYPRSGKTYHMTEIALDLIASGERVASRHEIEGALPITSDLEMVHLSGFHVFLDEWHIDRSARDWRKLPKIIKHLTSQASKYDLHIYWSAQSWWFMPSEIRAVTEYAWLHEPILRHPRTDRSRIGLHRATRVAGCELEAEHQNPPIVETHTFWIRKKIASKYNSKRAIFVPDDVMSESELQAVLDPKYRPPVGIVDHPNVQPFREVYFVERDRVERDRLSLAPMAAADESPDAQSDADEQ